MTGHFPAWIFYVSNFLCKQRKHPSSEEKQSHHLKKYEAHDSFSDMHIWEKLCSLQKTEVGEILNLLQLIFYISHLSLYLFAI